MRVLIADDDPQVRSVLAGYLRQWGYDAVDVADGVEAWAALTIDDPPRLAILDWMMPGMDGPEICRKLSKRKDKPLIYTLLLSGRAEKDDLVYALDSGAHDYLTKPIYAPEMRSRLAVGKRLVDSDDKIQERAARLEELVEERARQLIEVRYMARTDALTGVPNRRHFEDHGKTELSRARRYKRPLSILMFDIDHFKKVNDTYGHDAGDAVLKAVAAVCPILLREGDSFARIGGEEFAALLPETRLDVAAEIAERLRKALEELTVNTHNAEIGVTTSIGISAFAEGDNSIDQILKRADQALYEAKHAGRNRVVVARSQSTSKEHAANASG